jgi:hypothetical protein
MAGGAEEIDAGEHRLAAVPRARDSLDEERHHFVTDQLVDDGIVAHERLGRDEVEPVEQRREFSGASALGQSR